MAYDITTDPDINQYDTDDLQDITKAAMGEGGREVAKNAGFYTFLWIVIGIATLLVALIAFARFRKK